MINLRLCWIAFLEAKKLETQRLVAVAYEETADEEEAIVLVVGGPLTPGELLEEEGFTMVVG
jgi:hypothetical protein